MSACRTFSLPVLHKPSCEPFSVDERLHPSVHTMSGAEAFAVIGLISSIITVVDTTRQVYDAATNVAGLHEAFRLASQKLPLVLDILIDCQKIAKQAQDQFKNETDVIRRRELEQSAEAVRPIVMQCQKSAEELQTLFEKVFTGDGANWFERYRKAVTAVLGKKSKVEHLMSDILNSLQLLQAKQIFKEAVAQHSTDLGEAIQEMSDIQSSLPEEDARYNQSGSGPMNINGSTDTQNNYTQSGRNNTQNFGGQTQYLAK
ncbi:Hypothetical protein R9X50_00183700 [Acrodontium crateriforme]|uniref:NACHT-NTPase and P-loop NTPases N-terminal domain-containing protein n=1 Tax=Acrodontium crateriforme TaxID=150365 RepID=A0AAQ3M2R3_9PEZI|nr:Hypothetical protein R9X50_00183700 [Acrodontium crateriforme]